MKNAALLFCFAVLFYSCGEQIIDNPPPTTYELKQNYPNPFTDSTTIEYGIPALGGNAQAPSIQLIVYDRFQRKQSTILDNKQHAAGNFKIVWKGNGINGFTVPPGIYYLELQQSIYTTLLGPPDVQTLRRITIIKK